MSIPGFLRRELEEAKCTENNFVRFHKYVHLLIKILKYIAILLYFDAINCNNKNNKVNKHIANNFLRPTEGQWLSLFEVLINQKSGHFSKIKKRIRMEVTSDMSEIFNRIYAILFQIEAELHKTYTIHSIFAAIIRIKNKKISHGMISDTNAQKVNSIILTLIEYIISEIKELIETPLFYVLNNEGYGKSELTSLNHNEVDPLIDNDLDSGVYAIINNVPIKLDPFVICRDGSVFLFNSFDSKNQKTYYTGGSDREIYCKAPVRDLCELFSIDKEALFLQPLKNNVRTSEKGVTHNLPDPEYKEFVGRSKELSLLQKCLEHPRNFLTALDGIGGVGKTAIARRFCEIASEDVNYSGLATEFIVWVSAKTTKLVNGKIQKINQAFEHLDQLLDTILDVLSFQEYRIYETITKIEIVNELLSAAEVLLVIDNLETISNKNLMQIWDFLKDIPEPSKVLLTSREYNFDVPQVVRIENLSNKDAETLCLQTASFLMISNEHISQILPRVIKLSSGLPIALTSILGQYSLGRSIRSIEKAIKGNTDDLSGFCFKEQLSKLDQDHLKVSVLFAISENPLSVDSISYILGNLVKNDIEQLIDHMKSLSIIKLSRESEEPVYSMLSIIKDYILTSKKAFEFIDDIKGRLNDYYSLQDTESYILMPIEEREINKGSLLPRKLVDRAMKHAENDEFEEAENVFQRCVKEYSNESYVFYVYALFLSQFRSKFEDAITQLKRAIQIEPNYIYFKKIGDLHIKLKNFEAAIKNYQNAYKKSENHQNKTEMEYQTGIAYFYKAKAIRKEFHRNRSQALAKERNRCYSEIISLFKEYLEQQPSIYDGKKIKVYRILAESYFGMLDYENALKSIENAIDISEYDDSHVEYRNVILTKKNRVNYF